MDAAAGLITRRSGHVPRMLAFILLLIIVWIAAGIIGAVVHGLFWLLIVAIVLFLLTLVFGGSRLRGGKARR